jgi:hypothetical protein
MRRQEPSSSPLLSTSQHRKSIPSGRGTAREDTSPLPLLLPPFSSRWEPQLSQHGQG